MPKEKAYKIILVCLVVLIISFVVILISDITSQNKVSFVTIGSILGMITCLTAVISTSKDKGK